MVKTIKEAQDFVKNFAEQKGWKDYPNIDKFDHLHEELIGMAAPQLGILKRVFVTEIRKTKTRKSGLDGFRVFINPKITRYSQKTVPMYEGCGSIFHGNLFGEVSRPKNVDVEYTDENGDQHKERFRGLLARVVQHEYDHIEGILFTERMTDLRTLMDKEHYLKMVKGK